MRIAKIALLLLTAFTLLNMNLEATNHPRDGGGYIEIRRTAYLSPVVPVGIVILAGSAAFLFRDHGHQHHGHAH